MHFRADVHNGKNERQMNVRSCQENYEIVC